MSIILIQVENGDKETYTITPKRGERRIICAAERHANGDIICSPRHNDSTHQDQRKKHSFDSQPGWRVAEQGFIDQWGKFLTRGEAWVVAKNQGQIIFKVGGDQLNGGTLYSENLY